MAKKKSGNKKAASGSDEAGLDCSGSTSPGAEEVADLPPAEQENAAPAAAESASEMEALRAENQALKEQLAAKDAEVEALRQQLQGQDAAPKFDRSKLEDVEKLQARLATLRKEQAEADAARDAAWKQLKNVVSDISKLASPDYLASINVPIAPVS